MRYVVFLACLVLVACGKDEAKTDSSAAAVAPGVTNGQLCNAEVVREYNNNVVLSCKGMTTIPEARVCKQGINTFLAKYPNVNCQAEDAKTKALKDIKESELRDTVRKLEGLDA